MVLDILLVSSIYSPAAIYLSERFVRTPRFLGPFYKTKYMFTIFSKIQFLSDQLFDLTYQLEGHFMRKYCKKAAQKRLIVIEKIGEVSILNHDEWRVT